MDINIKVNTDEFITKELQWYIKSKLPEIVNENLFNIYQKVGDKNEF